VIDLTETTPREEAPPPPRPSPPPRPEIYSPPAPPDDPGISQADADESPSSLERFRAAHIR
jgi:hypothetical protein